ncbi:hypothetical protein [Sorangium sp. So ce117]|uniref:hypothetical protein n=1 Tax=Sorangium sp. So ce117 TaxID=3133277 RepID=UPI003F64176D
MMKGSKFVSVVLLTVCLIVFGWPAKSMAEPEKSNPIGNLIAIKGYKPGMPAAKILNDRDYSVYDKVSDDDLRSVYSLVHKSGFYYLRVGVAECGVAPVIWYFAVHLKDSDQSKFYELEKSVEGQIGGAPNSYKHGAGRDYWYAEWLFGKIVPWVEASVSVVYSQRGIGSSEDPFKSRVMVSVENNKIRADNSKCAEAKKKKAQDIFNP